MEGLYYMYVVKTCSDQLGGYCKDDLHLCFYFLQTAGFLMMWLMDVNLKNDIHAVSSVSCIT